MISSPSAYAGTCTISSSGTYAQADLDTCAGGTLDDLVVNVSQTLTLSGAVTVVNSVTVNGTITHAANTTTKTNWIDLTAASMTISSTGKIDVKGKGYTGGAPYTSGNGPGGGATGTNNYYRGGGGGGHGGAGGNGGGSTSAAGGVSNDSIADPNDFGSGGGSSGKDGNNDSNTTGATGGGLIRLSISGTLDLQTGGLITAAGTNSTCTYFCAGASNSGGAGAGGGIKITAGTLSGGGNIIANGGSDTSGAGYKGGGGGGGMIAIYYTNIAGYTGNIAANGGSGYQSGGAGTIYKKDSAATYADLTISSANTVGAKTTLNSTTMATISTLNTLTITANSNVDLANALTINNTSMTIAAGNTLTINSTLTADSLTTWIIGGTVTSIASLSATSLNSITLSGTLSLSTYTLNTIGSVTIQSGGNLTHRSNITTKTNYLDLSITNLTIESGGQINVNGKGYTGGAPYSNGNGPGGGATGTNNYYRGGGGGGHGGAGGNGAGNPNAAGGISNDSIADPNDFGSGGGSSGNDGTNGSNVSGATGGGLIRLNISGTLDLQTGGLITAVGSNSTCTNTCAGASNSGGAGAGGGIKITAGTLSGGGNIIANGGSDTSGAGYKGGGGGGGMIAVHYTTMSGYTGTITANGGTGNQSGGAGTIYKKDSAATYADLTISSANTVGAKTTLNSTTMATISTLNTLTITANSNVDLANALTINNTSMTIAAGNTLTINSTLTANSLTTWIIGGTVTSIASLSATALNSLTLSGTLSLSTYILNTIGSVTIQSGGNLTHRSNTNSKTNYLDLTITNLTIESGGQINVNGKGYTGGAPYSIGNGPGGGATGTNNYYRGGGGGGHGGAGGNGGGSPSAAGGVVNDSSANPNDFGSGGGSSGNDGNNSTSVAGAAGGGLIRLNVPGTFDLQTGGLITATGNNSTCTNTCAGASNSGGAGAGGGIKIIAGTFTGGGNISANGGNDSTGAGYKGGGGGGGLVTIYYANNSGYSGSITVAGGTGNVSGANGILTQLSTLPSTPSITAPITNSYNFALNGSVSGSTYSSALYSHSATDWKISTDSGGSTIVWSVSNDASNLTTTTINTTNGSFGGVLSGQTALASNTQYYVFVRYKNSAGYSQWSSAVTFSTVNNTNGSTQTWSFDNASHYDTYNSSQYVEVNNASNGLARLKDLGGSTYRVPNKNIGGNNFIKRVPVSITNANGITLTDFQVKINISSYDSDMQPDFDDIRFLDSDNTTVLDYHLASKVDSTSATFWVKIPSLPNGGKTIYMYYGNAAVSTTSNGPNTYVLFKDMQTNPGGTLTGSATYDSVNKYVQLTPASNSVNGNLYFSGDTGNNGYIAEFQFYSGGGNGADAIWFYNYASSISGGEDDATGGYTIAYDEYNDQIQLKFNGTTLTSYAHTTLDNSTWRAAKIEFSGTNTKVYLDGSLVINYSDSVRTLNAGYIGWGSRTGGANNNHRIKNLIVYKNASSVPTASLGSESAYGNYDEIKVFVAPAGQHPAYISLGTFTETLGAGNQGYVRYQISNDGTNWYWHNGTNWTSVSFDATDNNTATGINSFLPAFPVAVGKGQLYVKAFLVSDGSQRVELDAVSVTYNPLTVNWSAASQSVAENVGTVTVTASLNGTFNTDVSVPFTIGGTATGGGTDHNAANGTIVITAGLTTGNSTFTVNDDSLYEGSESVVYALGTPSAGSQGNVIEHSVTITDNDSSPSISFASSSSSGLENIAGPTITISLSAASGLNSTVNYAVSGGTATGAGTDYTLASGTATITAGTTTTTISPTIVNDVLDEPGETIQVTISSPGNATLGATTAHTFTITDDDATPTVSVADVSVSESSATATITLSVVGQSQSSITVDYATSNGTATAGEDYTATSGTKTWNSGDTADKTFTVSLTSDVLDEDNETANITLSNISASATLSDGSGLLTINDDDASPTIGFTTTTGSGAESTSSSNLQVSLSTVSGRDTTVNYAVTGGTATGGGTDFTLSSGTLTITKGSTSANISLSVMNDATDEDDETVIVGLSSPASATLSANTAFTYTISDDDTAGVTIAESGGSVVITEGGTTDTYTAALNSAPTSNVTITLTPNAQQHVSPATLTFTAANWNVPQTITVTATDDLTDEASVHAGLVTHASSSTDPRYVSLSITNVIPSITDNDTSGVSIAESSGSTTLSEDGGTDSYTVVLTTQPTANVGIALSLSNAESSLSTASLSFTPANWNTPQTITVMGVDDDRVEGNHTSLITHAATSSDTFYNALAINTVTTNLTDDDTAGVIIAPIGENTAVTEGGLTDEYTIVLMSEPAGTLTVTPSHDTQLSISPASVTFTTANWNTPQTITVSAANDSRDETFLNSTITHAITTSADSNYPTTMSIASLVVAITDDEEAGITVTESSGTTEVSEDGMTDTYSIVLTSEPSHTVTINLASLGQVATGSTSIAFAPASWNVPQTITVTAIDDDEVEEEGNDTITHVPTSDDTAFAAVNVASVTVFVTDNDTGQTEDGMEVDPDAPGSICSSSGCTSGSIVSGIVIAAAGDTIVMLLPETSCPGRSCNMLTFGESNTIYTTNTDSIHVIISGDRILVADPAHDDNRGMVLSAPASLGNTTIDLTTLAETTPAGVLHVEGSQVGDLYGSDLAVGDYACSGSDAVWVLAGGTTYGTVYILNQELELINLVLGSTDDHIYSMSAAGFAGTCGDDLVAGDGEAAQTDESEMRTLVANSNIIAEGTVTGFNGIAATTEQETVFDLNELLADFTIASDHSVTHADTGDVNGDGFDDLVTVNADDCAFEITLGQSLGEEVLALNASASFDCPETGLTSLLVADTNGDAIEDILLGYADAADGRGKIYIISGRTSWGSSINYASEITLTGAPATRLGLWLVASPSDDGTTTLYSSLGNTETVSFVLDDVLGTNDDAPAASNGLGSGGFGCGLKPDRQLRNNNTGIIYLLMTVLGIASLIKAVIPKSL